MSCTMETSDKKYPQRAARPRTVHDVPLLASVKIHVVNPVEMLRSIEYE